MSGFSILFLIVIALLLWNWFQRSSRNGRAGFKGGTQSERKLVKVVGRPAATRLIEQLQQRNPDRSRDWCADKALLTGNVIAVINLIPHKKTKAISRSAPHRFSPAMGIFIIPL